VYDQLSKIYVVQCNNITIGINKYYIMTLWLSIILCIGHSGIKYAVMIKLFIIINISLVLNVNLISHNNWNIITYANIYSSG